MYKYTVISKATGNALTLSGVESKWQIRKVTGLNPPATTVHESNVVGIAGVKKTGSKVGKRNIVFTIHINYPCEENRAELMAYLGSDSEITLHIETQHKDVYIDGTVETCEYDIYSQSQDMQVSIVCDYPYFKYAGERVTDSVISEGGFEFPLDVEYDDEVEFDTLTILDQMIIYNYGQITTGLEIELLFTEEVTNPKVFNVDDPTQYIGFNDTFYAGDVIKINTNTQAKASEMALLIRGNKTTKLLSKLMSKPTWFKIKDVLVLGVEGRMYMTITNHDELAGI